MEIKNRIRKNAVNSFKQVASHFLPNNEKDEYILKKRALQLAEIKIDTQKKTERIAFVKFSISKNQYYGIPYSYATEVLQHSSLTAIPCVPSFIAGAINNRGMLIPVLDLTDFLYKKPFENTEDTFIIVVTVDKMTMGILVNTIVGSDLYDPALLDSPLSAESRIKADYMIGIYQGITAIINVEKIMQDPRLRMKRKI